jgi:hypothetical protein
MSGHATNFTSLAILIPVIQVYIPTLNDLHRGCVIITVMIISYPPLLRLAFMYSSYVPAYSAAYIPGAAGLRLAGNYSLNQYVL